MSEKQGSPISFRIDGGRQAQLAKLCRPGESLSQAAKRILLEVMDQEYYDPLQVVNEPLRFIQSSLYNIERELKTLKKGK